MEQNFKLWDFEEKKAIELTFKKDGEYRWKTLCCFHEERHESLYYYEKTESYICYGADCRRHGVSYEKYLRYAKNLEPYKLTEKLGEPVASYAYRDEEGKLLYQKFRFEKRNDNGEIEKTYRLWRPDSKGNIIRNIQGVRRIIYNLNLINDSGDKIIFLLEGEKDCDNLTTKFGVLATTSDIGAGRGLKKWRPEYYEFFQDRDVIIIPDNDKVSKIFYREIGNNLVGTAKSIKFLELPDLKEHGDTTDWLMKGGTLADLFELIKQAPKFPLPIPIEERFLVTAKELIETDLNPLKMLVGGGLIPKVEGYALIGGLAKEGKTLLSTQLGLNLVSGTNFLEDFKVDKKCKILYIYRENTKPGLKMIIEKQIEGLKKLDIKISKDDLGNFHTYYGRDITLTLKNPLLGNIERDIKAIEPDIIFLDPIGQFIGFDINKAENIKRFRDLLMELSPGFWVLIHHYTKPRYLAKGESDIAPIYRLLGSSYLANTCESFIGLEKEGEKYSNENKKIYFITRREREPIPLHLRRDPGSLIYEVVDSISLLKGRITKDDIVRILKVSFKGKASYKDLVTLCSDQFGIVEERVAKLMRELKESGVIDKEEGKRGFWYLKKLFF